MKHYNETFSLSWRFFHLNLSWRPVRYLKIHLQSFTDKSQGFGGVFWWVPSGLLWYSLKRRHLSVDLRARQGFLQWLASTFIPVQPSGVLQKPQSNKLFTISKPSVVALRWHPVEERNTPALKIIYYACILFFEMQSALKLCKLLDIKYRSTRNLYQLWFLLKGKV